MKPVKTANNFVLKNKLALRYQENTQSPKMTTDDGYNMTKPGTLNANSLSVTDIKLDGID